MFVAKRNLVHCGEHADNCLSCESRQRYDMSYHGHVVFASQLRKNNKHYIIKHQHLSSSKQSVTFHKKLWFERNEFNLSKHNKEIKRWNNQDEEEQISEIKWKNYQ